MRIVRLFKCPDLMNNHAVGRNGFAEWGHTRIATTTIYTHLTTPTRASLRNGEQAVLDYFARYVFRIALTNARIVGLDDETVTIQYKDRKPGRARICRFSGEEFMRRFLQHVLPRGFHKVRYFGLWHPTQRDTATRVRQMLQLQAPPKLEPAQDVIAAPLQPLDAEPVRPIEPMICPHCHQGRLIFIRRLTRPRPWGHDPHRPPLPRGSAVAIATNIPNLAPDDAVDRTSSSPWAAIY